MGSSSKLILACGWEGFHNRQAQGGGGGFVGTVTTTGVRTGSHALQLNGAQAWNSTTFVDPLTGLPGSTSMLGASFSFYISAMDETTNPVFLYSPLASIDTCWWAAIKDVSGNKRLQVIAGGSGGAVVWTGTNNLSTGTIYVFESFTYNPSGSSLASWSFRVKLFSNADILLDDSGWQWQENAAGSAASTNSISLGPGHNVTAYTTPANQVFIYDDLVLMKGPPPRGAKILPMYPNATGTDTAWTGDYTAVNEVDPGAENTAPAGDFLTVGSGAQDETHNAAASGLTLTSQDRSNANNIIAVVSWIYANRSAGTLKTMQHRLRTSSGGNNSTKVLTLTATLQWHDQAYPVSPLTGNEWTATGGAETDIDALQFGVHSSTSIGAGNFQVDTQHLEVVYGKDFKPLATTLNEDLDTTENGITVTSGATITAGDIIEIDNEWMLVNVVVANVVTVTTRGKWTTPATHTTGSNIYKHPWNFRQRGAR